MWIFNSVLIKYKCVFPRPNNKIHPMEVPGSKPTVTRNPSLDVIPPPNRPTIARNPSLETPTKTVAGSRKASPRGETPERNPPLTRIVYIQNRIFIMGWQIRFLAYLSVITKDVKMVPTATMLGPVWTIFKFIGYDAVLGW